MALLSCSFSSRSLEMNTTITVILPEPGVGPAGPIPDAGFPTLYLLHGLGDDDTGWTRMTSIERYVEGLGLAVVMPEAAKSFYCDEVNGSAYWTYLSEELPAAAQSFFPLSPHREHNFVAGLSMGGYGALKWALRSPERFSHAASMSGCLDLAGIDGWKTKPTWAHQVFGDQPIRGTESDLLHLLATAEPASLPAILQSCGTEDELFEANLAFERMGRERGVHLDVDFGAGGHTWDYWDARLRDVIAWLPVDDRRA